MYLSPGLLCFTLASAFQFGWLSCAAFAQGDDDPVRVVLDVYRDAVVQQRETLGTTPEQRIAFNRDWRERILGVARQNPDSPHFAIALTKAVGISNGLGEYEASLNLARELLGLKADPEWRFRWESELGEISKQLYSTTKSKEIAAQAIAHFRSAEKILPKIPQGSLSGNLQEQRVLNLSYAAVLLKEAVNDHQQSAVMFEQARQYLDSIEVSSDSRLTAGYDVEYLASSEMIEFLRAGNPEQALEALEAIASQKGKLRWAPSYYAHQFAQGRYPKGGSEYRSFIKGWLNRKNVDGWTPFLQFYLARDLFHFKEYQEALPIYLSLKDEHAGVFLKQDQSVSLPGRGGFYAEILYNLAVIYDEMGERGKSVALTEELQSYVPQDPRIDSLAARHSFPENIPLEAPDPKGLRRLWISVNLIVIVVIVLVIVIRKRMAHL